MTQSREFAKVLFSTVGILALAGCIGADSSHGEVIAVTDKATLDKYIKGDKPVIVKFSATWCPPCKAIAPMYKKQSSEFKGKVAFLAVDINDALELAQKHAVNGVPTFLYFKDGKVIKRNVGGSPAYISTDTVNEIFGLK